MARLTRTLNHVEEWTLVLVMLGMAFLSFIQVFCRYALGFSFVWMEELNRYVGVFLAFLGSAIGVKYGTHFSMDLLYEKVGNDRFLQALQVLVNVLAAGIMLVIAWYGWQQAMKLRHFGVLTSVLRLPKYWAYLPIPFFSMIMTFRFAALAVKHAARFVRGKPFKIGADER